MSTLQVDTITNSSGVTSISMDSSGRVTQSQLPFFHVQ